LTGNVPGKKQDGEKLTVFGTSIRFRDVWRSGKTSPSIQKQYVNVKKKRQRNVEFFQRQIWRSTSKFLKKI
jgi:hypothetical protein